MSTAIASFDARRTAQPGQNNPEIPPSESQMRVAQSGEDVFEPARKNAWLALIAAGGWAQQQAQAGADALDWLITALAPHLEGATRWTKDQWREFLVFYGEALRNSGGGGAFQLTGSTPPGGFRRLAEANEPALWRAASRAAATVNTRRRSGKLRELPTPPEDPPRTDGNDNRQRSCKIVDYRTDVSRQPDGRVSARTEVTVEARNRNNAKDPNAWVSVDTTQILRNGGGADVNATTVNIDLKGEKPTTGGPLVEPSGSRTQIQTTTQNAFGSKNNDDSISISVLGTCTWKDTQEVHQDRKREKLQSVR